MRNLGLAAVVAVLLSTAACAPKAPPPIAPVQPVATNRLPWPDPGVFQLAQNAYRCAVREGRIDRSVLTIIDYSLPSAQRRLWVIDMLRRQVLHHELVAHGEGSGSGPMAKAFSNQVGSHQSSLGLYRTDEIYHGQFGYSLRLSGLEPAINDKARERAIVVHGADNVSDSVAARWGMVGRSWGCPALPVSTAPRIIDSIAGGSALFVYYPDDQWLRGSRYLNCAHGPY